jgi:hypothetical protein
VQHIVIPLIFAMPALLLIVIVAAAKWAWETGSSRCGTAEMDRLLERKRLGLLIKGLKKIPDNEVRSSADQWMGAIVTHDRPDGGLDHLVQAKRRGELGMPDLKSQNATSNPSPDLSTAIMR